MKKTLFSILAATVPFFGTSTWAAATNFQCDADHAAACETLCKDAGGSWSSTDNSCCDAARAATRPKWPTMSELNRLYSSPPKNSGEAARPANQLVPSPSMKK